MIDTIMKSMITDSINGINTTMQCRVVSKSPLTVQPIKPLNYKDGRQEYPLITNPKIIAEWTLTLGDVYPNSDYVTDETTFSGGTPIKFSYPIEVGDLVLVAIDKFDMTDAVILGVI